MLVFRVTVNKNVLEKSVGNHIQSPKFREFLFYRAPRNKK